MEAPPVGPGPGPEGRSGTASRQGEEAPRGRGPAGGELERLLREDPTAFDLFQAIRVLELLRPDRAPVGGFADPADEGVRFTVPPRLAFPAGEIDGLEWTGDGPARMAVNAFGLTGPQGVMPLVYTQAVADRVRERDTALRDFLDLFHHRLISLLYRAWRKYRFTIQYGREGGDLLTTHLLDLVGLSPGAGAPRGIAPESLIFYAGLLAPPTRSPVSLELLLADYFGVPVEVESFVGGWYRIHGGDLTRVGDEGRPQRLGSGAVVGDEVWDPSARIRIRLGPLDREEYDAFLPGGDRHEPLRSLIRFFSHDRVEAEVKLVLRREQVGGVVLGGPPAPLAWATWLRTEPLDRDPEDTVLVL